MDPDFDLPAPETSFRDLVGIKYSLKSGNMGLILVVRAIVDAAIAVSANADASVKRSSYMSDIALTVTVFHTLAAVAIFGFMVVSVVGAIQRKRQD
jgi:hypothetical protein